MADEMFCSQCERTAECTGKAGVCRETSCTAELQDKLTGTLIGLARATDGDSKPTDNTYCTIIEGLFTTLTNFSFDDDSIERQIDKTHAEKTKLVPQCESCGAPCGRNDDYDMQKLWTDNEDIRSLKSLILFALRGMAAYAYHALMLGYSDEEVNKFFCEGLFIIGEELTTEQLLPTVMKVGKINLKCMALLDKANTKAHGTLPPTTIRS